MRFSTSLDDEAGSLGIDDHIPHHDGTLDLLLADAEDRAGDHGPDTEARADAARYGVVFDDEMGLEDDDEEFTDDEGFTAADFGAVDGEFVHTEFGELEDQIFVDLGSEVAGEVGGAPAAPLPPPDAHWPIRSTHPRGTEVGQAKGRRFGARRGDGARRHAGIDLFANAGDEVVACQAGVIVNFFGFCCGTTKTTFALFVEHGTAVINYGEVTPDSLQRLGLEEGDRVVAGQPIGYVGKNPRGSSMLHLEMYRTGSRKNLRWYAGNSAPSGLLDPTGYLRALSSVSSSTSSPTPSATARRLTLRFGADGSDVEELQRLLVTHGLNVGVDGDFGVRTRTAVETFQRTRGLAPDGVVGARTWAALMKSPAPLSTPDIFDESSPMVGLDEPFTESESSAAVIPRLRTDFPVPASRLPDVFGARQKARFQLTVPGKVAVGLLRYVERKLPTRSASWIDQLWVGIEDLASIADPVAVHIDCFQARPAPLSSIDVEVAVGVYLRTAYAENSRFTFDGFLRMHGKESVWAALEMGLGLPDGSLRQQMTDRFGDEAFATSNVDEAVESPWLLFYLVFPDSIRPLIAPRDFRALRGFGFDSAELTPAHHRSLSRFAFGIASSFESMAVSGEVSGVTISGHTDRVGARRYNRRLGQRRAEAVTEALKSHLLFAAEQVGVKREIVDRMSFTTRSLGEDRPIFSENHLNRRVEIDLTRKLKTFDQPLERTETIQRIASALDAEAADSPRRAQTARCVLERMGRDDVDDRYVVPGGVFLAIRDNVPAPKNRALVLLLHPAYFGRDVLPQRIAQNLLHLIDSIQEGIDEKNRRINIASGAAWGLGLLALSDEFKTFSQWLEDRFADPKSIYSCFR